VSNDWNIQGELQRVKDGEFFPYNEEVYLELSDYSKKVEDVSTVKLWMRISDENYASLKADWTSWMNQCKTFVTNMEIVLAAILFSVIVIIIAAFPKDTNAFGAKFDRIWLEATILLGIIFFGLSAGCATAYVQLVYEQVSEQFVHMAMAGILFFELLTIYCCISIVRKIKMRYFLKSSVCYKAIKKVFVTIRAQKEEWSYWKNKQQSTLSFKEKEMKRKRISLIITLISGIICIFVLCVLGLEWPGVMILALIAAIFMIRFYQKLWKDYQKDIQDLLDLEKILQQIYEISNGNLHAQTDINGQSLYYKATTDLASIGQGMAKSVEEQLKGERMKIDLITNVSHDLKTPLTSIISYIDLLSKDETLSDEARDYVSILERKSERLKNIVIDLFDLAKSTSGNAEVDFSILDMRKLVDQTLIEMEDKVQESGFEIITDYEAEHAQFEGDANRMYRVVQNVLENALKYSLKGSRIYIKVSDLGDLWQLSIKNTASYRMKFTEEEILERFSRGDKSRTTEGSGLGLSIAENFTKLCGGEFHIKIDGDQFVVEIRFGKKFAFIEEV
jgi:signal transduction histidine kinase